MNVAYDLALLALGALLAGPAWMAHALNQDRKRREWAARQRERELRR